jgi:hypothetical protein
VIGVGVGVLLDVGTGVVVCVGVVVGMDEDCGVEVLVGGIVGVGAGAAVQEARKRVRRRMIGRGFI